MIQIKYKTRTSALRRMIYTKAMQLVAKGFENDKEEVSAMRDQYCKEMFGKEHGLLSDYELQRVLDEMNRDVHSVQTPVKLVASKVQISRVRFLALWFAIEYCNLKDLEEVVKGVSYKDEALRKLLRQLLDKNGIAGLTHFLVNALFNRCANPKCHQLLIEGNFKKSTRVPARFYYQSMKPEEASYLIMRFEQIRSQKEMKVTRFAQNSADEYLQITGMAVN